MDHVNRYENRTIWGSGKDMENKWGAVKVIMRARPAGTFDHPLLDLTHSPRVRPF